MPKHQPTIDYFMDTAETVTVQVEMKEEGQVLRVLRVTGEAAYPDFGTQVVVTISNV